MATRYNLALNENYELIDSYYAGSAVDRGGEVCSNCGRMITNVATIKNSNGNVYQVGMDCAETLTNLKGLHSVSMEFSEMKAIRAKINKAIKQGSDIDYSIYNDGTLRISSNTFTIYKDIEFSKKYLSDYLFKVSNPNKIGFTYINKDVESIPYFKPSENLDFQKTINVDGFMFEISVKPYYHLVTNEVSGYDPYIKGYINGSCIVSERLTMIRDLQYKVNSSIRKYYFDLFDNPINKP